PARKKIAEAPQAGKAHFHADIGDRMLAQGKQEFRPVQPQLDAELVRRQPEYRLKLPDKVKRRDADFARDIFDREPLLRDLSQHLPRATQTTKSLLMQQHDSPLR